MTDATTPRPHPASPAAPARRSLLIEDDEGVRNVLKAIPTSTQ